MSKIKISDLIKTCALLCSLKNRVALKLRNTIMFVLLLSTLAVGNIGHSKRMLLSRFFFDIVHILYLKRDVMQFYNTELGCSEFNRGRNFHLVCVELLVCILTTIRTIF
jgi:hypothetical protein